MEQLGEFILNHWVLSLALVVIVALLIATSLGPLLQGVKEVDPLQATELLNHQNAVILDVRKDDEYREGHLPHDIHIPLERLKEKLPSLQKYRERPIIAVCRSGQRSLQAAALLRKQGFEEVYNLKGGILAWKHAHYPLIKEA
ncbi:MAG: rhodanese-like domain-containing protein [Gammaproteobacteria bacterium]|nr:MAG: rhodanese-like domain-containing protein [Gammaproteobacteria bacterium]